MAGGPAMRSSAHPGDEGELQRIDEGEDGSFPPKNDGAL